MAWRRATAGGEFSKEAEISNRADLNRFLEESEADIPYEVDLLVKDEERLEEEPYKEDLPEVENLDYVFEGEVFVLDMSVEEFTCAATAGDEVSAYVYGTLSIEGDGYEREVTVDEFYETPATDVFHWDSAGENEKGAEINANVEMAEAGSD
ncbi:MAG: hypothetical protein H8Z69_05020 [Nanohaloarchaea archaeon]|nr:hypothetical protein [Candidatus Nanohaloarchaea archaeon]